MSLASVDSVAIFVTRISSPPCSFSVPANSRSPGFFPTGSDSPVIDAWFTLLSPSTTTPSTGIASPGRTSTRSSTASSSIFTTTVCAPRLQSAVSGRNFISAVMAERLFSMAISCSVCESEKRKSSIAPSKAWFT